MMRLFMAVLVLCGAPARSYAHEMSIGELELRELSKGQFMITWGAGSGKRPIEEDLKPVWPEGCHADELSLKCPERGMIGRLAMEGVGKTYSAAIVRVIWLDQRVSAFTLSAGQPTLQVYGSADDTRGATELARTYLVLGVEHILSGFDHLLFVIGLLFLVGFQRRLIATITAFTLAHSLTLACSVLGWLSLRPAPVEACIALSIVLVAGEALHERETLARRLPALVAFLFGLVHGLGFAGALQEVGLPRGKLAIPLLTFNIGVEIGQLMTVAAAYGLTRALALTPVDWGSMPRRTALYAIGITAAYWSWLRITALGS
jgi:hydrogenase/urease accessory protein HupE